jgi:CarD family transcriptional regulator
MVVVRPQRAGARPAPKAPKAKDAVNGKAAPPAPASTAGKPAVPAPAVAQPKPGPQAKPPRVSPFAIKAPPPTNTAPLKLVVGDKAVHPKLGLGEVVAIEERVIGGSVIQFYVLRILDKSNSRAMVPTNLPSGLRAVMSDAEAEAVLDTMRAREVAIDLQPWSRRFRAYTEMINSGLPHEVAKVLRDMYRLKFDKDLSFGERRLLDQAKSLLMKELAAAKKITEETLVAQVAAMFQV